MKAKTILPVIISLILTFVILAFNTQTENSTGWNSTEESLFINKSDETLISKNVNQIDIHNTDIGGHGTKSHFQEIKNWGVNGARLFIHPDAKKEREEEKYLHWMDQVNSEIEPVEYISESLTYVERLVDNRWVSDYWKHEGKKSATEKISTESAFELAVKFDPSSEEVDLTDGWQFISNTKKVGPKPNSRQHTVELAHNKYLVSIKIHTLTDGTAVLTRWLEIINNSKKAIALTKCFPWSGRLWSNDTATKVGRSQRSDVAAEGWFGWTPLQTGTNVFANRGGVMWDDPYFMLPNQTGDEYFFGQLAWSANYQIEFEQDNGLSFKIGPTATDALRVISAGESATSPKVHLGYTHGGFDVAVQEMHKHIRRSVIPDIKPNRAYRIQCLMPEDRQSTFKGNNYTEKNLKKVLNVMNAVGMELFIVDGPTWAEGTTPSTFNQGFYGNWNARKKWFPNGFDSLVDYAHSKDIYFGLYGEPEGGRGDWSKTSAFQEHPEWFTPRRPMFPGNNFLNIAIPEAAEYMSKTLFDKIIRRHRLDLYRHDQNGVEGGEGSVSERDGFKENDYWRHYEALCQIFENVNKSFPDLILQQAAAGGAKMDLMAVSLFNEHFTTDRTDVPPLYQMASGLSVFLPPEILVAANGMTGLQTDMLTLLRGTFAIGNTPMLFNGILPESMGELDPKFQKMFLDYGQLYREFIRPLLATSKVYHHAPVNADGGVENGNWFAMEFMSPDQTKGWATIVHFTTEPATYLFKPMGLDSQKKYKVTFDNTGQSKIIAGAELMLVGLTVQIDENPRSELLIFETID